MAVIGLFIAGLAFLASLGFNLLQLKWRNEERAARAEEKAEQKRKEDARETEQRRKEQAPPQFFNFGGTPGPILLTGRQHSSKGPFWDIWGLVTVVNGTQVPMKITPLRLVLAGEEWPLQGISFHLKSNTRERSDRITLRGNDKEHYELHIWFPEDKCPTDDGELWLTSDNRTEEFSVPLSFPQ
jgi:hypothetical protein